MKTRKIPEWIYWLLAAGIVALSLACGGGGRLLSSAALVTSAPVPKPSPLPAEGFGVSFLDVGQGDSALIICDGQAMLIDAGEPSAGERVTEYLKGRGVERLAFIVATHAHSDHCGGLDKVVSAFPAETLFAPYTEFDASGAFTYFEDAAAEAGLYVTVPPLGAVFTLGSAEFTFIGPVGEYGSVNDGSLVLRLEHGGRSYLFTGDASAESLYDIYAQNPAALDCDVLKLSHHGAADALDEKLLEAMSPECAVISVGADNDYGHPSPSVLALLESAGVTVRRTDLEGTVVMD